MSKTELIEGSDMSLQELLGGEYYTELQLKSVVERAAKGDFMPSLQSWLKQTRPDYNWSWQYMKYLIDNLQKLSDGKIRKLMISLPPRSGKSTLCSIHFPVYFLEKNPENRVIIGTYNQTLANKMSRGVRTIAKTKIPLNPDRKAMEEWETLAGGGVRAVGVGAGIAGIGANLIILDDVVRSRKDASSITVRNSTYAWYTDDIFTRMEPDSRILIIMCLRGSSNVLMSDGTWEQIKDIVPGEHVVSYNIDKKIFENKKVLNQAQTGHDNTYTVKTSSETLTANAKHPFLTTEGYKNTSDLTTSDILVTLNGTSQIVSIEYNSEKEAVYDLEVEDNHNFVAEGIVVSNTRWHEDDLIGRIERLEDDWTVINLPAIAEDNDPLGRKPGEALNPERYPIEKLYEIRRVLGRSFNALYQGRPTEQEGEIFKASWFRDHMIKTLPQDGKRRYEFVRYWDKAASEKRGDYTVGVLMARDRNSKTYYILNVVRGQWESVERDRIMLETAAKDQAEYRLLGSVRICHEQEPGSAGKDAKNYTNKLLAGFPVKAVKVTGNKKLRAEPYASQCEAGNVYTMQAGWNEDFIDEHAVFDNGAHDDMVDAASGAFNQLSKGSGFISLGKGLLAE